MLLHKCVYEFHFTAPYSSVDFTLNAFVLFFLTVAREELDCIHIFNPNTE